MVGDVEPTPDTLKSRIVVKLEEIARSAKHDEDQERIEATKWRKRRWFAALPAVGTAAAGGGLAFADDLQGGLRTFIVLAVFVAFGIGAFVAGLAIPEKVRAHGHQASEYQELALHVGILREVEAVSVTEEELLRRFRQLVSWLDRIRGVEPPSDLYGGKTVEQLSLSNE